MCQPTIDLLNKLFGSSPSGPDSGPGGSGGGACADGGSTPCATCKLVSLTVIRNATQNNVIGSKNWAAVKKSSDDVIVQAKTDPDTLDCWNKINWSGDSGSPVPGHPNQRSLSRTTSKKYHVQAELGGVSDSVDVWVIWADLEVKIGSGDTIDTGNDASGLAAGHKWPSWLGGGNQLGPMTSEGTSLTYGYTIGKMQAKATLSPPGIEDVVRSGWHMRRRKTVKGYSNGSQYRSDVNASDNSTANWVDEDPKSGTSTREIYDLDAPGNDAAITVPLVHTHEVYKNFTQSVIVTLDSEVLCSDETLWSYQARIDADKATGKVELNQLALSHVSIPAAAHYSVR